MNSTIRLATESNTTRWSHGLARALASCGLAAAAATAMIFAPAVIETAPAAEAKRVSTVDGDTCTNGDWGITTTGTGRLATCFKYRAYEHGSSTDIVLSKNLRASDKKWLKSEFSHSEGTENRGHFRDLGYILDDSRNNWKAGDRCPTATIRGQKVTKFDAISAGGTFLTCSKGRLGTR